jgi:hypothetical protein
MPCCTGTQRFDRRLVQPWRSPQQLDHFQQFAPSSTRGGVALDALEKVASLLMAEDVVPTDEGIGESLVHPVEDSAGGPNRMLDRLLAQALQRRPDRADGIYRAVLFVTVLARWVDPVEKPVLRPDARSAHRLATNLQPQLVQDSSKYRSIIRARRASVALVQGEQSLGTLDGKGNLAPELQLRDDIPQLAVEGNKLASELEGVDLR